MSPSRLEAFSDGVLAIAITLLVLDIHVPSPSSTANLAHELGAQWPSYAAYVVSFLTIGIIWINHHAMIRRLGSIDHGIMTWNLLLLLCVGALPFTTALMAAYLKEGQGEHLAAAIYSASFLVMSLVFAATQRHILFSKPQLLADKPAAGRAPSDPRSRRVGRSALRGGGDPRVRLALPRPRALRWRRRLLRPSVRQPNRGPAPGPRSGWAPRLGLQ